jgi:hypothetical protein
MSHSFAEATHIHGSHLLDQNPSCFSLDVDLGTKRRRPSAARSGGNEHDGPRQQLVGLDHHAKPPALLLMSTPRRGPEDVDVTPEHAGFP